MKNKKQLMGGIFGLFAIMLTIFAVSSYASASEELQRGRGQMNSETRAQMQTIHDSITRTVENIDNGAVITMTSDNAEAVTFLQEERPDRPQRNNANVTETVENITNGVKITITSDDADEVARIQENTANPKGEGMRLGGNGQKGGKEGFGQKNPETRAQMQAIRDSITRTAENIDNGVVITMTSDNAEAVTFLQEDKLQPPRRNESVTETIENITNGVKITITSDDADEVARIQENTANPKGEGMRLGQGKEGKRGSGCGGGRGMGQRGGFGNQE